MRRCAQLLCQSGAAAVARSAPAPMPPASRAALLAAFPKVSNAVGFRAYSTEPPAVPLGEHATGLELKELKAEAEGRDYFDHFDFLKQPYGTKENPVVVTSVMPWRIVGATDPDDDSIVHWGKVQAGQPPMKIGDEWFVHKSIEDAH